MCSIITLHVCIAVMDLHMYCHSTKTFQTTCKCVFINCVHVCCILQSAWASWMLAGTRTYVHEEGLGSIFREP